MRRFSLLGLVSAITAAGACSLVNAPADVVPGTGGQGGGAGECKVDKDCPAAPAPCTRYVCAVGGTCQILLLKNGETCDDGRFCTEGDTCDETGACTGTPRPCPGQDDCHPGKCDDVQKACTIVVAEQGAPCDDKDPCTEDGTCDQGTCVKGPDACAKLATDCTTSVCGGAAGCVTANKQDGINCGQSACSNGLCQGGHCEIQAVNEGQPCDDGLFCTINETCQKGYCKGIPRDCPTAGECVIGTCDEATQSCVDKLVPNLGACDDGDACTAGEFCFNNSCSGGLAPSIYFSDDFSGGGKPGWALDMEWQIGKAQASVGGHDGEDPAFDYTGEGDVAGVVLGGLAFVDPVSPEHPAYYLTSPAVNTDKGGAVFLTFYRWLVSDYQPYMRDTIEASSDDGMTWQVVWENSFDAPIADAAWTFQSVDITAFKSKSTRVRFGFAINSVGVYSEPSWNIDLVKVQNTPCGL